MAENTEERDYYLAISVRVPLAPSDPEARRALMLGYRLRAEVLRMVSDEALHEETRKRLLGMAENYDLMAATLEKMVVQ